jgi:hypothetical protein
LSTATQKVDETHDTLLTAVLLLMLAGDCGTSQLPLAAAAWKVVFVLFGVMVTGDDAELPATVNVPVLQVTDAPVAPAGMTWKASNTPATRAAIATPRVPTRTLRTSFLAPDKRRTEPA